MQTTQVVRCPNCGSFAERRHFTGAQPTYQTCPDQQVSQTECQTCDYLLVMCSINGRVIEGYSPGRLSPVAELPARTFQIVQRKQQPSLPQQIAI